MPLWFRIVRLWLPVAVAVSAACGIAYLGVQQSYRQGLNDPQIQLAEDGAARLDAGATPESVAGTASVEAAQSLSPFVMVLGTDNRVLASAMTLNGAVAMPPTGVLDAARKSGENRVTWQPRSGVRIASVSVATKDGRVVVAGRNMRAVEARIDQFGQLALVAWVVALLGTLVAAWLVEVVAGRWSRASS